VIYSTAGDEEATGIVGGTVSSAVANNAVGSYRGNDIVEVVVVVATTIVVHV
jgi:hypothetical protein